jgi:dTDP-4-amino-4,6-dideoxygalactose transaminase
VTAIRIPIAKPWFGAEERAAIAAPLETGWVVQGPRVAEFERRFAAFVDAAHAAATTSCTTALHLAVVALGLEPGDEVIVPAFTWVSSPNAVLYTGATPVFCDIDLDTFNASVEAIDAAITPRTVGIMPVHLFGLCADMPAIVDLARRRGLWIVEDAACGFGARIDGRHAGTFGDVGCFSFHPRKAITTGEGGMTTTADAAVDARIRRLRDHGASCSDFGRHTTSATLLADYDLLGFNYRMTDIQGALGCAQMDRADDVLRRRRLHAARYDERLSAVEWLRRPRTPERFEHGFQSYVCLFQPEPPTLANAERLQARRDRVMAALERRGIATRQGTHAAALTGYYAAKYNLRPEDFPNAFLAERLTIALPMYAQLAETEVDEVAVALVESIDA